MNPLGFSLKFDMQRSIIDGIIGVFLGVGGGGPPSPTLELRTLDD